jgi:hypothetical protein
VELDTSHLLNFARQDVMPLRRGSPRPKLKRGEPKSPLAKHFEYTGSVAVPYTTTVEYADRPDHVFVHKSMSINWIKALDMGLRALAKSPEFNCEIVPRSIKVQRK